MQTDQNIFENRRARKIKRIHFSFCAALRRQKRTGEPAGQWCVCVSAFRTPRACTRTAVGATDKHNKKKCTQLPCKLIVHVVLLPLSSTTTLDTGTAAIAEAGQNTNDTR